MPESGFRDDPPGSSQLCHMLLLDKFRHPVPEYAREPPEKEICFAAGLSLAEHSLAISTNFPELVKIGQRNAFCLVLLIIAQQMSLLQANIISPIFAPGSTALQGM